MLSSARQADRRTSRTTAHVAHLTIQDCLFAVVGVDFGGGERFLAAMADVVVTVAIVRPTDEITGFLFFIY